MNNFEMLIGQNAGVALVVAILAGFVSSFSPCTLSTLPLIIGYIAGSNEEKDTFKKKLLYSITFCIGIIITFTVIGVISAALGKSFKMFGSWWYFILAIILVLVAMQLFGVFEQKMACKRPRLKKNLAGAFLLGILGGFFDSPCSTPVLLAITVFISQTSNIMMGVLLMIAYSIGHCMVIILACTSFDMVTRIASNEKYNKVGKILKVALGIIVLIAALYLFYIAF